jgi:hypothetical protein
VVNLIASLGELSCITLALRAGHLSFATRTLYLDAAGAQTAVNPIGTR